MQRRDLVKSLAGGALAAGALATGAVAAAAREEAEPRPVVKPPRLAPGMTVGLVAPAGASSNREEVRYAIDVLRSLGYRVKESEHVYARTQYLAGTDRQRAADLNAMFADPEVQAIFTLRGGYGTMRTLPYLDYETIAKNPKVVIGYSDISGLLFGLHARTGLVGFHGPCATSTFSDYTLAEYRKVIEEPQPKTQIAAPPEADYPRGRAERQNRITTFVGGRARGRLIGGNLSLLSPLIGSPYAPDLDGVILFLEDVNEAWYRIDRMLTHLLLAGQLQKLAGIVLGKFTKVPVEGNSFNLEEITEQLLMPLGIPIVRGLMIGHIEDKATVPLGIEAELDADAGTLTLLEPAVA